MLAWSLSQAWEKHHPEGLFESRAAADLPLGAVVLADVSFAQSLLSESVASLVGAEESVVVIRLGFLAADRYASSIWSFFCQPPSLVNTPDRTWLKSINGHRFNVLRSGA